MEGNSFHFILKRGTAAPPKEGRGRQHHPKEAEEREKFSSPFGWCCLPSLSQGDGAFPVSPFGCRAFQCLLLGGAAWPLPSFGRAAFLPLLSVGRRGESTTTRRRERKTAAPKWRGVKQHHPKCVKSTSPLQKNGYENCNVYSNNINMSDEDNKHDTNYINKHKYTNHGHAQAAPVSTARRARSLRCTPLDVVSHAPHGSRCS